MSAVIEIRGLRKTYQRVGKPPTVALSGLDLDVPAGGVFGFLGPNGSGKTTTIRCLLGLAPSFEGQARLFGEDVRSGLPAVIHRMGAIVESPSLFPGFSGYRNLELLATIAGMPRSAIDAAIERVGLTGREGDRVGSYSLGMKQRLAIAATLLKEPELLILDEPANGLDPAGIREIRLLVRALADEGRTVFVSSHQLGEIQQVADRVAILRNGRCVVQGTVHDVLAGAGGAGVLVKIDDVETARTQLTAKGFAVSDQDPYLRVEIDPARAAEVAKALAGKRLYPSELRPADAGLEDAFLALTGDEPEAPR